MILKGENFQSWKDFSIEIEGLTVLTGPSDLGKSSIYRALKGAVRNNLPNEFVRVGSKNLSLNLEIDNVSIEVKRGKKSSSEYKVDGEDFSKLSRDVPPKIKALGMGAVELGGFSIDPIFSGQHDSKFLLQDVSPTELNTILGAFSSTEKLDYGKREANLKISRCNSEAKTLSSEIQEAETRKFKYREFFSALQPYVENIQGLERKAEKTRNLKNSLAITLSLKCAATTGQAILESLTIPDVSEADKLSTLIQSFRLVPNQRCIKTNNRKLILVGDQILSDWGDILTSIKISNTYVDILNKLTSLRGLKSAKSKYHSLDSTSDYSALIDSSQILNSLNSISKILEETNFLSEKKLNLDENIQELNKECGIVCPQCGFSISLEE